MDNSQKKIDKGLQYDKNPRTISGSDQEQLEGHLLKFGDIGGVVYCRNNKAYVGGNQRSKIFDGAEINLIEEYEQPQQDKTIAIGFINWNGNKYLYREVVFTEEEFKEACIAANNDGGEWDKLILSADWTKEELEKFGFNTSQFEDLFKQDEELRLASDDFEPTTSLEYLKFGKYKIPLTDVELAKLNQIADDHFSEHGTLLGLAQILIGHVEC